jgi:Mg2+ and Co2+ transporter CorA
MKTAARRFLKTNWLEWVTVISDVARHWQQASTDIAKIEAAIYYVKTVRTLRLAVITVFSLIFLLILLVAGLFALHVSIVLAPWNTQTKAWTMFGLGLAEFLISVTFFSVAFSQKFWMKFSKTQEMTEKLT